MKTYNPARRRIACSVSALLMSAVTMGLLVAVPYRLEAGSSAVAVAAAAGTPTGGAAGVRPPPTAAQSHRSVSMLRSTSYSNR